MSCVLLPEHIICTPHPLWFMNTARDLKFHTGMEESMTFIIMTFHTAVRKGT